MACKIRGLMVTVCPSQFATRRTLFHVLVGCGLLMLKVSRLKLPVIWLLFSMWLNTLTFFFSSRRRHTIWKGDWSSDVCSSDLVPCELRVVVKAVDRADLGEQLGGCKRGAGSEERRVGKECRSRWSPYHYKKKARDSRRHADTFICTGQRDKHGRRHRRWPAGVRFGILASRARPFFFQAEDGIRAGRVTGVQTCALPICPSPGPTACSCLPSHRHGRSWDRRRTCRPRSPIRTRTDRRRHRWPLP